MSLHFLCVSYFLNNDSSFRRCISRDSFLWLANAPLHCRCNKKVWQWFFVNVIFFMIIFFSSLEQMLFFFSFIAKTWIFSSLFLGYFLDVLAIYGMSCPWILFCFVSMGLTLKNAYWRSIRYPIFPIIISAVPPLMKRKHQESWARS